MKSYWYRASVAAIEKALASVPNDTSPAQVRRIVADAYPFGPRAMWPYKKWCEAQRDMLHCFNPKNFPARSKKTRPTANPAAPDPNQQAIFGGPR